MQEENGQGDAGQMSFAAASSVGLCTNPAAYHALTALPGFPSLNRPAENVYADTFMTVVIPCHDETDLITTLQSLLNCDKTNSTVEVIVVINSGEQDSDGIPEQNAKTHTEAAAWIRNHQNEGLKFHLI